MDSKLGRPKRKEQDNARSDSRIVFPCNSLEHQLSMRPSTSNHRASPSARYTIDPIFPPAHRSYSVKATSWLDSARARKGFHDALDHSGNTSRSVVARDGQLLHDGRIHPHFARAGNYRGPGASDSGSQPYLVRPRIGGMRVHINQTRGPRGPQLIRREERSRDHG
jgi:hypothetical protein